MERYFRALNEYMQDVRRFQEGGQVAPEITDENIRRFVRGKTDKQIARVMMRLGISLERFARAVNRPLDEVRARFERVMPEAQADVQQIQALRAR